jgi:hypothetical protein
MPAAMSPPLRPRRYRLQAGRSPLVVNGRRLTDPHSGGSPSGDSEGPPNELGEVMAKDRVAKGGVGGRSSN